MTRTADTAPRAERDVYYGLAITAETLGRMLLAGDHVGEEAGKVLCEHAHLAKIALGFQSDQPKLTADRTAVEHAIAQELEDVGTDGLTIRDAVDRLWTDFADHYAHRPSFRKALYDVLTAMVAAGTAHAEGLGKRGQEARYYQEPPAPPAEEGIRRAASQ